MAEELEAPNKAEFSPDAQTTNIPPWNKEWGRITPSVNENLRAQVIESDIPPWEKEWGRVPKYDLPAFNSMMGIGGSLDFDTVFDKLIQAESRGRHRDASGRLTTSPVGAKGITQVMPKTAKNPGYGVKPIQDDSEEEYLRFGRDYLTAMWNEFDGDARKAVAAYNAGAGNVKKAVARAREGGGDWTQYLPKKSETIPYMNKILGEG
jgi:hypothetical protein